MPHATIDDVRSAQRILVYGVTGSGKSTAALALGELLGLPVHLVDEEIGWLPGWAERPKDEQVAIAHRLVAEERWILDSAYGFWKEAPLSRADVVVGLDYPRWLSLSRLVRRTVMRIVDKTPICNGNVEDWSSLFGKDSIVGWHFSSFKRKHERMVAWESSTEAPKVYRVRRQREMDRLLAALRR